MDSGECEVMGGVGVGTYFVAGVAIAAFSRDQRVCIDRCPASTKSDLDIIYNIINVLLTR
jgi:hypothetical protein